MPEEDLFELCALTADDFANVDMGDDERVVPVTAPQRASPTLSTSTTVAAADSTPAESWAAEQRTQNEEVVLLSTGSSCLPEVNGALSDEQCLLHRVERCVLETNAEELETISSTTEAAEAAVPARKQALYTAQALVEGDFEQLLSSCTAFAEAAPQSCSTLQDVAALISSRVQSYIAGEAAAAEAQAWRRAELNWLGAAALNLFLQSNYTGPELSSTAVDSVNEWLASRLGLANPTAAANSFLSVDGELPYPRSTLPGALLFARVLLAVLAGADAALWTAASDSSTATAEQPAAAATTASSVQQQQQQQQLSTLLWWSGRACVAHGRLLLSSTRSATLWAEARHSFGHVIAVFGDVSSGTGASYVAARAWQEWGLAQHHFDDVSKGKHSFARAQQASGLQAEVSGAMGKRTKYQEKELAQIVLLAQSAVPVQVSHSCTWSISSYKPCQSYCVHMLC
jgi:hypothetical protein